MYVKAIRIGQKGVKLFLGYEFPYDFRRVHQAWATRSLRNNNTLQVYFYIMNLLGLMCRQNLKI